MDENASEEYIDRAPEDYSKYVPELDSVSSIKETENYIRAMLRNVFPSAWGDAREVCRKESGVRYYLFNEIFDNMVADETTYRVKRGEMVFDVPIPRDDEEIESDFPFKTWSEIADKNFPVNRWRVNQLVPLVGVTILAATSGGKKSWLAGHLVDSVTTPHSFLHENFFTVEGCNALYIDGEMALSEFQRRGKQLQFDKERAYKIFVTNSDKIDLYSEESNQMETLSDMVEQHQIGLVIIDTLRAVAGGMKEEKAEEVRRFFKRLGALKSMGVSIVMLDHLRKRMPGEGKTPTKEQLFSSQDKAASADTIIMLKPEDVSGNVTVYQVKNRLGQDLKPFRVQVVDTQVDPQTVHTAITFDSWVEEDENMIVQAKTVLLDVLENGPLSRKELLQLTKKAGIAGERTVGRAYKELVEAGAITKERQGRELIFTLAPPEKGDVENENDVDSGAINSNATMPQTNLF